MPLINSSSDRWRPQGTDSILQIAGKDTWGHIVANSLAVAIAALLMVIGGIGLRWLSQWKVDLNDLIGLLWSAYSLTIISLLYFLFHFIRAPLKKEIAKKEDKISVLGKQAEQLKKQRAEIAPLKERVAFLEAKHPKLTIEFGENDDEFFSREWFYVKVTNESEISSAHQSVLTMTRLSEFGKDGESVVARKTNGTPFPWVLGTSTEELVARPDNPVVFPRPTRFDLNPRESKPIPLATYQAHTSEIRFGGSGGSTGISVPPGVYRIHLQASGQNAISDEIDLVVGLNDSSKLFCKIEKPQPLTNQQADDVADVDYSPD
jgi:hypothetical protein